MLRNTTSSKRLRTAIAAASTAVLAVSLAACGSSGSTTKKATDGTTSLRLVFDFSTIDFEAVPFVVGQKEGFYKKHGLNVSVVLPPDTSSTVKMIARDRGDIGFDTTADVAFARATGIDVKSIANYSAKNNWGLIAKPGTTIDPASFKGKSFGVFTDSWTKAMMPYVLKAGNVSAADVKQIVFSSDDIPAMLAGKIDYATNTTNYATAAIQSSLGKAPAVKLGTDLGAPDIPIWVYTAMSPWLKDHAKETKAFLAATKEATQWAIDNPDKAVADFVAAYPNNGQSVDYNTIGWKATIPFLKNDAGEMLTQSDQEWSDVVNALKSNKLIDKTYPATDYYTNDYLPQ